MEKFDLYNYFFLKEAQNPSEEEISQNDDQNLNATVPVPGQAAQKNPQAPQQNANPGVENPTKDEILKKQNSQNSNVFSNFVGSTISDIAFKKNGATGGEISISISRSNLPLKISWAGDKVTVTQPNGNIISL